MSRWPTLALALACVAPPPAGASPLDGRVPMTLRVQLEGGELTGDRCRGGRWTLFASLDAGPAEEAFEGPTASLFDHSMPFSRVNALWFHAEPYTCVGPDGRVSEGRMVLAGNAEWRAIVGVARTAPAPADGRARPPFRYTVDLGAAGLAGCHVRVDGQALPVVPADLALRLPGGVDDDFGLRFRPGDLGDGFRRSAALSGQVAGLGHCGGQQVTGRLELAYKPHQPEPSVTLHTCLWVPAGAQVEPVAEGEPRGGTYRWRGLHGASSHVRAGDDPSYAYVQLLDGQPRPIGVEVTYQLGPKWARAQAEGAAIRLSLDAARLREPLQLGAEAVRDLRYTLEPARAEGHVLYVADDPGVVEPITRQGVLSLVPKRIGHTRIQAYTSCRWPIGPAHRVEVVAAP